uniref:Putative secreted salivary protein n=1 Tax=Xenopsylla cheopis TaxID=163159 RepID=A2IA95_XENCH|nr:putative secreted salivary protein [Xenopsylla cheopis]
MHAGGFAKHAKQNVVLALTKMIVFAINFTFLCKTACMFFKVKYLNIIYTVLFLIVVFTVAESLKSRLLL